MTDSIKRYSFISLVLIFSVLAFIFPKTVNAASTASGLERGISGIYSDKTVVVGTQLRFTPETLKEACRSLNNLDNFTFEYTGTIPYSFKLIDSDGRSIVLSRGANDYLTSSSIHKSKAGKTIHLEITGKENGNTVTYTSEEFEVLETRNLGSITIDMSKINSTSFTDSNDRGPTYGLANMLSAMMASKQIGYKSNDEKGLLYLDLDKDGTYDLSLGSDGDGVYFELNLLSSRSLSGNQYVKLNEESKACFLEELDDPAYMMNYYDMLNIIFPDAVSVKTAKITVPDKTYTGKAVKAVPTVKIGKTALKNGTDYTLTYRNNTKIGTASVTIKGKRIYNGTVTKKFRIVPKGTSLKKLKASKKSLTAVWKAQKKQTSGYQIQYSLKKSFKGAKTKNVSIKKTKLKVKKLKSKKIYYVRVRTFKKVGKTKYCSAWSKAKKIKVK